MAIGLQPVTQNQTFLKTSFVQVKILPIHVY
jgi:hypothetical protein